MWKVLSSIRANQSDSGIAADAQLARAQSEMEAVFKHATVPTDVPPAGSEGAAESTISWDRWYAGIAKASEPRILRAVAKRGNPAGFNTISLTVWPNHHIAVSLIQGHDPDFDAATLKAYSSLDDSFT
jgi:hypothetical protein